MEKSNKDDLIKEESKIETKAEIKDEPKSNNDIKKLEDNNEIKKEKVIDPLLDSFYNEIDDIKPEDFKTNSKEQLDRLLRPGSTYFNLNPFEVLQIDPYAPIEEIKKKYRKLSIYVHPDKNAHDLERAKVAFEAVNRAYKLLEDEKERKKCLEVVDEARDQVNKMCEDKRKKARKDLLASNPNLAKKSVQQPELLDVKIEEDDPDKYRHAVYVITCKLFADIERLKVKELEKKAEEKKRKAHEKEEEESSNKIKKIWDKNYEESRAGRVSSWQNFVSKKGGASNLTAGPKSLFKPPKHKPETR